MPSPDRGEVWIVDLGLAAKIRPCLVLSIPTEPQDRALVTLVAHTTSPRGSRFEVAVEARFLKPGVFDAQNRDVTVWVNSNTFLPVKQRFYRWDPIVNDRREEVTHYAKYRDVGNRVMWPFDVQRERDGEKVYEMYAEQVSVGDPLPDSMFELPSGAKILKKT